MDALTCKEFFSLSGWRCQPLVTEANASVLYVSTPLVLADGKPIDFYLEVRGDTVLFSDDGITMFSLRNYGFALEDRRNWRGLESIVELYGFTLGEDGAITSVFPSREMRLWSGRMLKMFCAVSAWQVDRMDEEDEDFSLTREVERLLILKAPDRPLERNVQARFGRSEFTFDFLWGNIYVDAVPPIPQAVNARLRKAIMVEKQADDDIGLLFVMDDRRYPDKAEREIGVLGQVAQTVRLSDFADRYTIPG